MLKAITAMQIKPIHMSLFVAHHHRIVRTLPPTQESACPNYATETMKEYNYR